MKNRKIKERNSKNYYILKKVNIFFSVKIAVKGVFPGEELPFTEFS
jgi:hypothetical protein